MGLFMIWGLVKWPSQLWQDAGHNPAVQGHGSDVPSSCGVGEVPPSGAMPQGCGVGEVPPRPPSAGAMPNGCGMGEVPQSAGARPHECGMGEVPPSTGARPRGMGEVPPSGEMPQGCGVGEVPPSAGAMPNGCGMGEVPQSAGAMPTQEYAEFLSRFQRMQPQSLFAQYTDPATGKSWWYDLVTGEAVWSRPKGFIIVNNQA